MVGRRGSSGAGAATLGAPDPLDEATVPDVFQLLQALRATRAEAHDRDGDRWDELYRDVDALIDRLTSLDDPHLVPEGGADRIHRDRISATMTDDLVRRLRALAEHHDDEERQRDVHQAVTAALRADG